MEKQENQLQFIYPVPFEDFVGFRRKQSEAIISGYSIKQLHKLRKLKKLLETTQQKICNRIKLFKKASVDIQKKRQKQNHAQQKIEIIKKQYANNLQQSRKKQTLANYLRSTKSSACGIRIRHTNQSEKLENSCKKIEAVLQEKHDNAKQIKMWKQRNKVIVEQRKLKEMREKIKSANMIRSHRNRAKQIKMQCEQQKLEDARKIKEQKFREEIQKYDELQQNLSKLQRQEREALIMWKRAMQSS